MTDAERTVIQECIETNDALDDVLRMFSGDGVDPEWRKLTEEIRRRLTLLLVDDDMARLRAAS